MELNDATFSNQNPNLMTDSRRPNIESLLLLYYEDLIIMYFYHDQILITHRFLCPYVLFVLSICFLISESREKEPLRQTAAVTPSCENVKHDPETCRRRQNESEHNINTASGHHAGTG